MGGPGGGCDDHRDGGGETRRGANDRAACLAVRARCEARCSCACDAGLRRPGAGVERVEAGAAAQRGSARASKRQPRRTSAAGQRSGVSVPRAADTPTPTVQPRLWLSRPRALAIVHRSSPPLLTATATAAVAAVAAANPRTAARALMELKHVALAIPEADGVVFQRVTALVVRVEFSGDLVVNGSVACSTRNRTAAAFGESRPQRWWGTQECGHGRSP